MRSFLAFFLLAAVAALPAVGADKGTTKTPEKETPDNNEVVEQIVARINNDIITTSEYQRSKDELRQEAQQQDAANADRVYAEREKDVLRDLIDQQLLLQKGKDLGITADTEVIKKLDDMRKQMHLDTMEDLEKAATSQGVSFEDFKQNLKNQIITQQVIGKEVGSRMNITKEEEQKYYDQHKNELEHPEQIRLSELLISTEKNGSPDTSPDDASLDAAKKKAGDLLAQIRKGASFEDLAKKNSNGPTAAQGGDLGYFKRGALAKSLEDITFAMKAGDVSDVIRTRQGYVILKVAEHQQAGVPTLEQIEPRLQDAIYMEKLQPALRAYLTKLREDAFIDIKPGYVDSGASPNETKPVETTTAQDKHAKKLKKKKKLGIL
ncbi:MAG TPA: peptidylprolyl isomerase [Terriglobales bacterium]|nr:peptidylprolyl isomerase [Terriglobales bacterium]